MEFVFADANDNVVLLNGSTVSGFSQLRVTNGSLDATEADLGLINYISVASSIKLNYAQLSNVSTLIADSASSEIEIVVASNAEADQLASRIASNNLSIFSDASPLKLSAEAGSGVTAQKLSQSKASIEANVKAVSQIDVAQEDTQLTVLDESSIASMSVGGGDKFINAGEHSGTLTVTVTTLDKYTVKSVSIGGMELTQVGSSNKYTIAASSLQDGTYTIVAVIEDLRVRPQHSRRSSSLTPWRQRRRPSLSVARVMAYDSEVCQSKDICCPESGSTVDAVTFQGAQLAKLGSFYRLNATNLENGSYSVKVTVSDAAGNVTDASKSFTVDRTSEDDAIIDIEGDGSALNSSKSGGSIGSGVRVLWNNFRSRLVVTRF